MGENRYLLDLMVTHTLAQQRGNHSPGTGGRSKTVPALTADAAGHCPERLDLCDAEVFLYPAFFPADQADRLLLELRDTTAWRQETITLYGKRRDQPRLTAWYGDPGTTYIYSGIKNVPLPWTPAILEIKRGVEPPSGVVFNSVLLNRYRTGKDSVSWHADDEPDFGEHPVIASVSFGGTRTFQLKHKTRRELKASVELTHGSLLIMRGGTQANWLHQIPKTAKHVGERLNLTFRVVIASDKRARQLVPVVAKPQADLTGQ
jgi:alkylated DNA repair dioxygenase AlkB